MPRQRQCHDKKKIILAVTGSFVSGKSTVARMLASGRARLVDADRIAHRVLRAKKISRRQLACRVFDNKALLKKLNRLTHPEVIRLIRQKIKKSRSKIIVLDAPLLIEAGLQNLADKLIVVKARQDLQIKRAGKKFNLSREEVLKRIKSQLPLSLKARLADFVIDNSGSLKETRKQVQEIRRRLWKS